MDTAAEGVLVNWDKHALEITYPTSQQVYVEDLIPQAEAPQRGKRHLDPQLAMISMI